MVPLGNTLVCTGINVRHYINARSVYYLPALSTFHPNHFTIKFRYSICSVIISCYRNCMDNVRGYQGQENSILCAILSTCIFPVNQPVTV